MEQIEITIFPSPSGDVAGVGHMSLPGHRRPLAKVMFSTDKPAKVELAVPRAATADDVETYGRALLALAVAVRASDAAVHAAAATSPRSAAARRS